MLKASPLRIGYLIQNGAPDLSANDGAEKSWTGPRQHIRAVIDGFRKRGHDVSVFAPQGGHLMWKPSDGSWQIAKYGFTQAWPFRLVESGVRRVQSELKLPYFGVFDSARFADACVQVFRDRQILYERYGLHGYGGGLAARRLGVPLILEVNGHPTTESQQYGTTLSPVQRALTWAITWQTWQLATRIVSVGQTLKNQIVRDWHIDPEKICVVPNGADVDLFMRSYDSQEITWRFGVPNEPTVVFVGSFQPWHGTALLIQSFALVLKSVPTAQLVLIGEGPVRTAAVEQVNQLGINGCTHFLGHLSRADVAAVLAGSDVAVIAHTRSAADFVESPLKLYEYMAAGKAVVAPDYPHMRKIIDHERTGLLFEPEVVASLAQAIERLLIDERLSSTLGANARSQAIAKHSWSHTVEQLETICMELIDRKGGRAGRM